MEAAYRRGERVNFGHKSYGSPYEEIQDVLAILKTFVTLVVPGMSVRRRLRSIIETRQVCGICWRCALGSFRYTSTAPSCVKEGPNTSDPSLPKPRKLRIRKHVSDKFVDPAQYSEARAHQVGDKGNLPKLVTKSGDDVFHDVLGPVFPEREVGNGAKRGAGLRDKVDRVDPSLGDGEQTLNVKRHQSLSFENQSPKIREGLDIGYEQQPLNISGEPSPRIKKYPISSTRLAEPELGQNVERRRPNSGSQAYGSVSGHVSPGHGGIRIGNEDDRVDALGRKPRRRRRTAEDAHSILRGRNVLERRLRDSRLEPGTTQHLASRRMGVKHPVIRRIRGLRSQTTIPEGSATTAMATKPLKKRGQALHQLEYFKYVKTSKESKAVIRKHFSRHDTLDFAESEVATLPQMQPSLGTLEETSIPGEASGERKITMAEVMRESIATAEHSPPRHRRLTLVEAGEKLEKPGATRSGSSPRNRRIRKGSEYQVGGIIRRVTQKEDSLNNPNSSQDELDLLIEKLSQIPKPYSEEATRLPESSLRASPFFRQGQSQLRPRINGDFKVLSGACETTATSYNHPRFASSLATQFPDVDCRIPSAVAPMYRSGNHSASETTREHLKAWKAMQGNKTRSGWTASVGSRCRHDGSLNTITQSGGDDEALTDFTPEEDLDAERQLSISSEDSVLEIINPHIYLRRGDLVELDVGHGSILGIFANEARGVAQIYTERGTWHQLSSRTIAFSIPRFVSPYELSELLPYVPSQVTDLGTTNEYPSTSNVPRDVGFPLNEKMVHFLQASNAVYRKHADRLNRAYEILSNGDCESQLSIGLEDAALRILQKQNILDLTPPMLLIVHRTLNYCQNILYDKKLHRMSPTFKILPQATLVRVNTVRDWLRAYQDDMVNEAMESLFGDVDRSHKASVNPIARFAAKARRVIAFNRQNRPLSSVGSVGPSLTKVMLDEHNSTTWKASDENQESFDHDEQQIIRFLDVWVASSQLNKTSSLHSLGPMILRATGLYQGMELGQPTGFALLQELGVIKPWDRFSTFQNQLGLPCHDPNHPGTILRDQAHDSLSRLSLPLHDSMAGFRKDWGDITVFCIDGEDTVARDDGISLEPVDGDPFLCWVHVHTANPSAFMSKDSPVARYARYAIASVYFPERVYPMMEAHLSQDHFVLANGRPCMTFSAKISADGDMIEKNISHGILSDVRYLTLQEVKQALAPSSHEVAKEDRVSLLQVGGDVWPSRPPKSPSTSPEAMKDLDDSDVDTLRNLQRISKALSRRRQRAGAVSFGNFGQSRSTGHVVPQVHISSAESQTSTIHNHQSRCIIGDPIISIDHVYRVVGEVKDMVTEFMILAGQICAIWCSERNIPIPYRGVIRNPDPEPSPEAYRESILDPTITSQGYADPQTWLTYMSLVGKVYASSSPLEHVALGLPAYCKITSPLRRYGDLFAHWQIEAAIRYEHATGDSLVGRAPATYDSTPVLPFSRKEVEDVARRVFDQERKIMAASTEAINHWMTQVIHRAFYFNEAPLPPVLEFTVRLLPDNAHKTTWGILSGWDKSAIINAGEASEKEGGYRMNDVWEGKIVKVLPYTGFVIMDPVRLMRREKGR